MYRIFKPVIVIIACVIIEEISKAILKKIVNRGYYTINGKKTKLFKIKEL